MARSSGGNASGASGSQKPNQRVKLANRAAAAEKTLQQQSQLIADLQAQLQAAQQSHQEVSQEPNWSQQEWNGWKESGWWNKEEPPAQHAVPAGLEGRSGTIGLTGASLPITPETAAPGCPQAIKDPWQDVIEQVVEPARGTFGHLAQIKKCTSLREP